VTDIHGIEVVLRLAQYLDSIPRSDGGTLCHAFPISPIGCISVDRGPGESDLRGARPRGRCGPKTWIGWRDHFWTSLTLTLFRAAEGRMNRGRRDVHRPRGISSHGHRRGEIPPSRRAEGAYVPPPIDSFFPGFRSSQITLIDSSDRFLFDLTHLLCVSSINDLGDEVVWVDGGNSINPYEIASLCRR